MDPIMEGLYEAVGKCFGISADQVRAECEAMARARANRIADRNAAYGRAVARQTDIQNLVISKLVSSGHVLQNRLWESRRTHQVARMLTKQVWNGAKGRMGTKLVMVYPDGRQSETMEKTISIRSDF
jgi:hypothetical protein